MPRVAFARSSPAVKILVVLSIASRIKVVGEGKVAASWIAAQGRMVPLWYGGWD